MKTIRVGPGSKVMEERPNNIIRGLNKEIKMGIGDDRLELYRRCH